MVWNEIVRKLPVAIVVACLLGSVPLVAKAQSSGIIGTPPARSHQVNANRTAVLPGTTSKGQAHP